MGLVNYFRKKKEKRQAFLNQELIDGFKAVLLDTYDYVDKAFLQDYNSFQWEDADLKSDLVKSDLQTSEFIRVGKIKNETMKFGILSNPLWRPYDKNSTFSKPKNMGEVNGTINYHIIKQIVPCVCTDIIPTKYRDQKCIQDHNTWYTVAHTFTLTSAVGKEYQANIKDLRNRAISLAKYGNTGKRTAINELEKNIMYDLDQERGEMIKNSQIKSNTEKNQ